jgi:branched-chain amino acid aminotransferase
MTATSAAPAPPYPTETSAPGSASAAARPGIVYVDGRWLAPAEARISVFDHGLLYGDGVFEGIRFYRGRVFRLERHTARLFRSARAIGLTVPVDPAGFERIVLETCARSGLRDGYLRPVVTRGEGDLTIDPRTAPRPSLIVICSTIRSLEAKAAAGISVITARRRKVSPAALSPNVKSLNYLPSVLARVEATAAGADEALMLDADGSVAEATTENLFVVRDGVLYTPPTMHTLEGVTREAILELAAGRYPSEIRSFPLEFVRTADEAFLVGTAGEVVPMVRLDGRPVGTGQPGPVTRALQAAFRELVESSGTPFPGPEAGTGAEDAP